MKSSSQGKDAKFKTQYVITLEGISKSNILFDKDGETFMESQFETLVRVILFVHNSKHKTTKAHLEIIKIK